MANKKQRQVQVNSVAGQIKSEANRKGVVPVPDGVTMKTNAEKALWHHYTHARSLDAWRQYDLLILARCIGIELRVQKYTKQLDDEGGIAFTSKGEPKPHPIVSVINTFQMQWVRLMSSISMGVAANNAIALNNAGTKSNVDKQSAKSKGKKVVNLLAD